MAHQIILKDSVLADLRQICLGVYDAGQKLTVEELLEKMMDHPEVPMRFPSTIPIIISSCLRRS